MNANVLINKIGLALLISGIIGSLALSEPALARSRDKSGEKGTKLAEERRSKKKKRRNKKKAEQAEAPIVVESEESERLHKAQEGDSDEPYSWDVSLLSDLSINNSQTGESKSGTADYDLHVKALRVLTSSFELGAGMTLNEQSSKAGDETNTTREYLLGLSAVYNFGDLNEDEMLFFVGANLGFGGLSSKSGDMDVKGSKTAYGAGLGLHYFVDTNVALTTEFSYDMGQIKMDGQDEPTKFSQIHLARIGFSLFL